MGHGRKFRSPSQGKGTARDARREAELRDSYIFRQWGWPWRPFFWVSYPPIPDVMTGALRRLPQGTARKVYVAVTQAVFFAFFFLLFGYLSLNAWSKLMFADYWVVYVGFGFAALATLPIYLPLWYILMVSVVVPFVPRFIAFFARPAAGGAK